MGLRDHQFKVDAKVAIERLRGVMCDADDFDPDDTNAKIRSDQAKELSAKAEKAYKAKDWTATRLYANDAMRIMEGN